MGVATAWPPRASWGTLAGVSLPTLLPSRGGLVELRRAVVEDVPAVVALLADDELGAGRDGMTRDDDLSSYLAAFHQVDADPAHLLLVATEEGPHGTGTGLVATMQLTFLPGLARRGALRAQVEAFRVRGDRRDRGLGALLLEWAVDEAARRGCALVQLSSDRSRVDAHRLYERLGFVATHEGFKLALPR